MSDNPDRLGHFHGATGSGRPSCEYPSPHSDQETASISTPSDDFDAFFDWDAYARADVTTDVTTQSDVLSEGKPAARPSPLTPAGPAARAASHQDDCPMPDAPAQEPQPPHVWPILSGPQPPRAPKFQLDASTPPPSPTEMTPVEPPPQSKKKTRVVQCPDETGLVREMGACYYCKINKSKCNSSLVCSSCSTRPFPKSRCIRKPLTSMIPAKLSRWNWNDSNFSRPGRNQFKSGRQRLCVSYEGVNSPCLEVMIGPFSLPNQKPHGAQGPPLFGILPDEGPSGQDLYLWMEKQIEVEKRTDFEAEMDRLLLKFAHRMKTATLPDGQRLPIPQALLSNVLKMKAMWKVWSCKQLYVRQHPGSSAVPLPMSFMSVQDSLRLHAAQMVSELERKVIDDIETSFVKKDTRRLAPSMRCTVDVTKWLVLWHLILIYRQSLSLVMEQQQTNAAPLPITVMPMNERHAFREATGGLLEVIIVVYSALFQKRTTVEGIRDAGPQVFANDCDLHMTYQGVWKVLPGFYQQVLGQVSPTDELFKEDIVKKEVDIMAKGRPARKSTG